MACGTYLLNASSLRRKRVSGIQH
ncbi:leu operon leader peptide [Escherichia coli]